jgi:hypothetical protein
VNLIKRKPDRRGSVVSLESNIDYPIVELCLIHDPNGLFGIATAPESDVTVALGFMFIVTGDLAFQNLTKVKKGIPEL